jgi:hypothetical protein
MRFLRPISFSSGRFPSALRNKSLFLRQNFVNLIPSLQDPDRFIRLMEGVTIRGGVGLALALQDRKQIEDLAGGFGRDS